MEHTEGFAVVEQQQPLADQVSAPSHWQGQEGCSQGLTPQWPGLLSRDPPLGPIPPGGRAMWAAPSSCVLVQWTPAPKITQEHLFSLPQALFGLFIICCGCAGDKGGFPGRFGQRKQEPQDGFLSVGRRQELALWMSVHGELGAVEGAEDDLAYLPWHVVKRRGGGRW